MCTFISTQLYTDVELYMHIVRVCLRGRAEKNSRNDYDRVPRQVYTHIKLLWSKSELDPLKRPKPMEFNIV